MRRVEEQRLTRSSQSRRARRGQRHRAAAAGLLASVVWIGGTLGVCAATVFVTVDGVLPARSRVYVSLCTGGLEPANCSNGLSETATGPRMTFTFADVTPGFYAVAAFQDLNGNGALDRSRNGLPLEPYGFSNGAGRTTSPRFERAAVRVEGDVALGIRLTSIAAWRPDQP